MIALDSSIKQSFGVAAGTAINSILGLLFYLLIIRNLAVGQFGEFSTLLAIGVLIGELSDLGVSASVVKFGHESRFQSVLTLGFYQRIFAGAIIIFFGALLSLIFNPSFLMPTALAVVLLFFNLINQSFVAKEKYSLSVGFNIFANILRLLLAFLIVSVGLLSPTSALWTFVLSYFFAFLTSLSFLILKIKFTPVSFSKAKDEIKTIMPFASFLGGSQAVAAITAKIDSPMLFALSGSVQTGLYSSAQKLASIISQFAGVLDAVFAPKLAKRGLAGGFKTYLFLAVGTAVLILFSIPFARWFVTLVFPPSYQASIPVLEVLLLGNAFFFLSTPFASSIVYTFGKSKIHLTNNILQLFATVIFYIVLVPKFGAMGAAVTFAVVNLISLMLFLFYHKKHG